MLKSVGQKTSKDIWLFIEIHSFLSLKSLYTIDNPFLEASKSSKTKCAKYRISESESFLTIDERLVFIIKDVFTSKTWKRSDSETINCVIMQKYWRTFGTAKSINNQIFNLIFFRSKK